MEGSVVLACASSRATTATTLLPTSMASRGRQTESSTSALPPSRAQVSNRITTPIQLLPNERCRRCFGLRVLAKM